MQVLMDYINELNWMAVVVAAVAGFVVNAAWYSRGVFGKQWMKGAKLTEKDTKNANMTGPIITGLVATLVAAVGLAVLFDVLVLDGVLNGAILGIMVAVAFVSSTKIMHGAFEQKSAEYMYITVSGDIVNFAVIGAVLALLR